MTALRKLSWSGVLLFVLFSLSTALFFYSPWRTHARKFFAPADRKVLSVAAGLILPEGPGRVVKLLTPEGVVLEAYGPISSEHQPLVDRILLGGQKDAHMQFQGRATNLALKDLNGDRLYEIIAPSYDSSLVPHLNIFRYNVDSKKFEPYVE